MQRLAIMFLGIRGSLKRLSLRWGGGQCVEKRGGRWQLLTNNRGLSPVCIGTGNRWDMHRIFISITLVLFTSSLYAGSSSCDFEKNLSDRDFYKKYSEELNIFYGAIGFNDFLVVKKGNRPLFCFEEKDFC